MLEHTLVRFVLKLIARVIPGRERHNPFQVFEAAELRTTIHVRVSRAVAGTRLCLRLCLRARQTRMTLCCYHNTTNRCLSTSDHSLWYHRRHARDASRQLRLTYDAVSRVRNRDCRVRARPLARPTAAEVTTAGTHPQPCTVMPPCVCSSSSSSSSSSSGSAGSSPCSGASAPAPTYSTKTRDTLRYWTYRLAAFSRAIPLTRCLSHSHAGDR